MRKFCRRALSAMKPSKARSSMTGRRPPYRKAGQENEADEIAERVGQRQDFGRYHLWNGRWAGSESPLLRPVRGDGPSTMADLAPKFYPVLSSPWPLDLPCWAVGATGAGAEPSA